MKKTEKFCYYNNYNFFQPRHFCKSCRRYWTHGGTLRDIPVGGGSHKNAKRSRTTSHTMSSTSSQDPLSATPVLVPLRSKHGSSVQFGLGGNGGGSDKGNVNVCGTFTSLMNAPHNHGKMKKTGKSYKPNGKSEERKDRKSRTGMNGLPKKRGHGGKFTWVGDGYSQPEIGFEFRGVFDVKDPNFEDQDETFTV